MRDEHRPGVDPIIGLVIASPTHTRTRVAMVLEVRCHGLGARATRRPAAARAIGIWQAALSHYLNRSCGSTLRPGVDPINGYVARRAAGPAPADSR